MDACLDDRLNGRILRHWVCRKALLAWDELCICFTVDLQGWSAWHGALHDLTRATLMMKSCTGFTNLLLQTFALLHRPNKLLQMPRVKHLGTSIRCFLYTFKNARVGKHCMHRAGPHAIGLQVQGEVGAVQGEGGSCKACKTPDQAAP